MTRITVFETGAAAPPVADRLVVLVLAALALGVFLTVIEVKNLVIFTDRFSIADAAWRLLDDEQYLLGAVIIVFSAVFPLGKAQIALVLWLRLKTTGIADARMEIGLWFFAASIVLTAYAVHRVKRAARHPVARTADHVVPDLWEKPQGTGRSGARGGS